MRRFTKTNTAALNKMPAAAGGLEDANRAGSKNERVFFGIVSCATALGLGVMLASLQALYKDGSGFAFRISAGTIAAFAIGAAAGLVYWRAALRSCFLRRISSLILFAVGAGAFLYPLRFLPGEKLPEVFQGIGAAAVALSILGFMLWRLMRFFDQDAARTENGAK